MPIHRYTDKRFKREKKSNIGMDKNKEAALTFELNGVSLLDRPRDSFFADTVQYSPVSTSRYSSVAYV